MCHHYHAYYSGYLRGDDVVIIHMEGDGGRYNSGVSIPSPNGLKLIAGSNQSDLGRLYQWSTLLMGMKPYHHEYKLMGLAPYATEHEVSRSFAVYENIFRLDEKDLSVVYADRPNDLFFHFRDNLVGHRFDGIAGALQLLMERHLTEWVGMVVKKTGRRHVCYGGGVAMNVKANMLISQLSEVQDLYVPISPGDESNALGAGYWVTEKHFLKNGMNPEDIPPLKNHYLGPECSRSDVLKAIEEKKVREKGFFVTGNVDYSSIARLIADGMIVGRMQGKSEFGQRALGNRSIIADPSRPGIVDKINHQIKYRDFWMPFCPTILDSYQDIYLHNPKGIRGEYMTMCYPIVGDYKDKLAGGIHQGDMTARPQILKRESNPEYYDLIKEFEILKGIGGVINTSFNLHGEPIVNGPEDALHTFFNSELDAVWMENILVSRSRMNYKTETSI